MRCNHWNETTRCDREAEVKAFNPEGKMVPGGYYCRAHADAFVTEYREKLREDWTLEPLSERGAVGVQFIGFATEVLFVSAALFLMLAR